MNNYISYIKVFSDTLAVNYHLNLKVFFIVYILSILPFYLGYYLILRGTTRNLTWTDIFNLKFKSNVYWNKEAWSGLYIHIFGRLMPYIYILLWGRNLHIAIYVVIVILIILGIYFFYKGFPGMASKVDYAGITISKSYLITEKDMSSKLWEVYNDTFESINKISPCKQSFDKSHFKEVLIDSSVIKYVITDHKKQILGMGLITNNFDNLPWISREYFETKYPHQFRNNLIYYFVGMAIQNKFRGNKFSIKLIEKIIDDLPLDAMMGFDHSKNINPLLHHFTKIVRQSSYISRTHIDQQHYHIVQRR